MSPFTQIFKQAGFKYAASIMNLVIVTAIISTANASLYTASRVLWYMGSTRGAPRILKKTNARHVPIMGVLISAAFCALFCLLSVFNSGLIFNWLINVIGLAGYIAWFGICLSHYRFRRAYSLQGYALQDLPYCAPWFPWAPLAAMAAIVIMMMGQQGMLWLSGRATWGGFITTYGGVVLFLLLFIGYKYIYRTKWVNLKDCRLNIKY